MSRTIKEQVHNQILLNQQLLNYNESQSSESESEWKNQNMPLKEKSHELSSSMFYSHQQMNQKRRGVLRQLTDCGNTDLTKTTKNNQKPLKFKSKQHSSQNESKIIVDLKSKLAQILKQSNEKSFKINQIENSLFQAIQKIEKLESTLSENSKVLTQKEELVKKLNFQNIKLREEYQARILQLQEQLSKSQQGRLSKISEKQTRKIKEGDTANQLEIQIQLKNKQIQQLKKKQIKGKKNKEQNKKLKKDLERLLSLLEKCHQNSNSQQRKNNKSVQKSLSSNISKKRSISLGEQPLITNAIEKSDLNSVRCSQYTKKEDCDKSSIQIKETRFITEPQSCLKNELSKFLKKWRVAQNNHKFVESLVSLIHDFTQTCIQKHRHKIETQYKYLKKEMVRKANQSLNFHQIMKERQIQIKLNKSLNAQSQKQNFKKTKQQFNNKKNRTISSDEGLSILVPASNKKNQPINRNSKLLSISLLQGGKNIPKQDICYNNLQQSIRLHQKKSNNITAQKINSTSSINEKLKFIFDQQSTRKSHGKSKTEVSNGNYCQIKCYELQTKNRKLI